MNKHPIKTRIGYKITVRARAAIPAAAQHRAIMNFVIVIILEKIRIVLTP